MSLTLECPVHFARGKSGRRLMVECDAPPEPVQLPGRVPRISKLMALAIHFQQMLDEKKVQSMAELARLGGVSRARITQIMNLNNLSPEIQEKLLFLPRVERGRDPVNEHDLRAVAGEVDWGRQNKTNLPPLK